MKDQKKGGGYIYDYSSNFCNIPNSVYNSMPLLIKHILFLFFKYKFNNSNDVLKYFHYSMAL